MRYPIMIDAAEIRALIEHHAKRLSGQVGGVPDGVMYGTADRIMALADLLTGRRVMGDAVGWTGLYAMV